MAANDVERRLVAILSADVVGYSRLMADDESGTIRTLTSYRTEIGQLVGEHRGRVVDFTGDNFLAEFPTALEAVEAALEIQRVLAARNVGLPEDRRMLFRMGLHLADIVDDGERLYGTGVNVAARLESLAQAGELCLSHTVREQVGGKLALDLEDLGEQTVKNISEPVHAYRVRGLHQASSPSEKASARRWLVPAALGGLVVVAVAILVILAPWSRDPGRPLTSIAVLPFDDMSPAGDQEWLADGLAEELIESLARIDALRVVARTSAFAFKGQQYDIRAIGEQLDVGTVVEGSVRRSGEELRITAQLIRVTDGTHLWSGRYDPDPDDIFVVQQEIAREIAEALRTELGVGEEFSWLQRGARYAPRDVRAYQLVRSGVRQMLTETEEGIRAAMSNHRQAIDIDPDYAQAHAELGWTHQYLYRLGYEPNVDNRSQAIASAEKAISIDKANGSAHNLLASLSVLEWDWEAAEDRFRMALELDPQHGALRKGFASLLLVRGKVDEALNEARRTVESDPLFSRGQRLLGLALLASGNAASAIEAFDEARRIRASQIRIRHDLWLALAHREVRSEQEAIEAMTMGRPEVLATAMSNDHATAGWVGLLSAALEGDIAESGDVCTNAPANAATLLAWMGESDRMFECLGVAVERHDNVLARTPLKAMPIFDPYRDDPRFQALLGRMNLAD